jgi:hypothetical protein
MAQQSFEYHSTQNISEKLNNLSVAIRGKPLNQIKPIYEDLKQTIEDKVLLKKTVDEALYHLFEVVRRELDHHRGELEEIKLHAEQFIEKMDYFYRYHSFRFLENAIEIVHSYGLSFEKSEIKTFDDFLTCLVSPCRLIPDLYCIGLAFLQMSFVSTMPANPIAPMFIPIPIPTTQSFTPSYITIPLADFSIFDDYEIGKIKSEGNSHYFRKCRNVLWVMTDIGNESFTSIRRVIDRMIE